MTLEEEEVIIAHDKHMAVMRDLPNLKDRIDDITGAELDAYKMVGDRLDLLEQKVELLLTHLGLQIEEDDD